MAHDHHDHSNCNHDHGSPKDLKKANDEINLRQQAAEKLAKSLVELQTMANEHKKHVQLKVPAHAVDKSDVELLIKEMQLNKAEAEIALKKHQGDLVATLTDLVAH
ncbi:hypothetical protein EDC96DRAFT_571475 [Choanephora cucurbitarum]|uniref:Nascent polypeptide-associated complex subunit alpha-like UBA domain-containing protein n=1 Tax=Choanephora cucurbitarum TaxID=101091 RepID=A0A1C7NRH1_9FUNG|nr:hypothetical protein EDC96DRAFT_571475 [Choanephora cucurbitarum]OBZ91727.1 hypothetical protein A0J61_00184 [Choanephora cucurbitarum]